MIENTSEKSGIDFINKFTHSGKPVKNLERIKRLLNQLGDPQKDLKFVHIAGTNGKGSVAEMFNRVFINSGLKTGCFTSPYIIRYNDRIRINGKDIPDSELANLAEIVKNTVERSTDKNDLSQFEITQAIAFLYFAQEKCDVVVLETGLGGLMDCTNVITTPLVTVITTIDLDHTAILGETISEIAEQKAGIIKPKVPCVLSANNPPDAVTVTENIAFKNQSQLVIPDTSKLTIERLDCFGSEFEYKNKHYTLSMGGYHQITNALSVIEGCELLKKDLRLTDYDIINGISQAQLPARVEILCRKPLIILDGAHNPDGLGALAKILENCQKPCHAIIGMCKDKNIDDAVQKLIPFTEDFCTVDDFSDRAIDKNLLAEKINSLGGNAQPCKNSLKDHIKTLHNSKPNDIILICGSLYLASYVKLKKILNIN